MTQLKVGDPVKSRYDGEYLGCIAGVETVTYLTIQNPNNIFETTHVPEEAVELVPRLTPEEAWEKVVELIDDGVLEFENPTETRHQCYRVLGGNGIKVTDSVRGRVQGLQARRIEKLSDTAINAHLLGLLGLHR